MHIKRELFIDYLNENIKSYERFSELCKSNGLCLEATLKDVSDNIIAHKVAVEYFENSYTVIQASINNNYDADSSFLFDRDLRTFRNRFVRNLPLINKSLDQYIGLTYDNINRISVYLTELSFVEFLETADSIVLIMDIDIKIRKKGEK